MTRHVDVDSTNHQTWRRGGSKAFGVGWKLVFRPEFINFCTD